MASTLVGAGFTRENLSAFAARLMPEHVTNFLNWLPRDIEMRVLARDLIRSTRRISDLVTAMKAYSHLDRAAEKEPVDVHEGLDATLSLLNNRMQEKRIEVVRSYGDVPRVTAFGGELNQVWTNLLDNAIAAVPEGGLIRVRTQVDTSGGFACIEIGDNGSGILPELQSRIFDPFFSTKDVQQGTGLGLDIAYRIIANRHDGSIGVESEPGDTRFTVRLPLAPR